MWKWSGTKFKSYLVSRRSFNLLWGFCEGHNCTKKILLPLNKWWVIQLPTTIYEIFPLFSDPGDSCLEIGKGAKGVGILHTSVMVLKLCGHLFDNIHSLGLFMPSPQTIDYPLAGQPRRQNLQRLKQTKFGIQLVRLGHDWNGTGDAGNARNYGTGDAGSARNYGTGDEGDARNYGTGDAGSAR